MATTDTVLQPGAEDLDGFTGPAGPTGPQGPAGSDAVITGLNIMSIKCRYYNLQSVSTITSANFESTYVLENGAKFNASPHTFAVGGIGLQSEIVGTCSNFLVTATDNYTVNLERANILRGANNLLYYSASAFKIELGDMQNNSFTWRILQSTGLYGCLFTALKSTGVTEFHFNILITA